MSLARLLVANRGEIAIRIARAAAALGIPTVGVFSEDDAASLHARHVDAARPLRGRGPRAYLDVEQLLAVARETGCDAVHPGYGFLSEQAGFARRCAEAGLTFVGPRPVEVQVVGDGSAAVSQLGERDCSLQRRHQKLVEVAPAPGLTGELRTRLAGAAVRMASEVRYAGVGTFEFLLDADDPRRLAFIEANPRLQVEHTVTEEVTGIDLVATQLALAAGRSLADLGLRQEDIAAPHGFALQVRVNMETLAPDGSIRPSAGVLGAFDVPTGPGGRGGARGRGAIGVARWPCSCTGGRRARRGRRCRPSPRRGGAPSWCARRGRAGWSPSTCRRGTPSPPGDSSSSWKP